MAKAIKHIKAGLLHIEIIGQVPEREGRKPRAARSRPTSAAQTFYNQKSSWRELELKLAANFGKQDFFVTLTYDDAHLPKNKAAAVKDIQKFFRKLRASRKKRGEELRYIYCTEGNHGAQKDEYLGTDRELEDKRLHHHVVLNGYGEESMEEIRSLWHGGGYVNIEAVNIHYYRELAKYMTKEAREFGRPKPGERSWRGSRNLHNYEVEYVEIPVDNVTLTAPPGAQDYVPFSEKNPYGFADCIGARYLLLEDEEPEPQESYAQPRKRKRRP